MNNALNIFTFLVIFLGCYIQISEDKDPINNGIKA